MSKLGKIIKRGITREEAMSQMVLDSNLVFQPVDPMFPEDYCRYRHAEFRYVDGRTDLTSDLGMYGEVHKVNLIDTSKQEVVLETVKQYTVFDGGLKVAVYSSNTQAIAHVYENTGTFFIREGYITKEVK
jgi:hypothetical protein